MQNNFILNQEYLKSNFFLRLVMDHMFIQRKENF